MTVGELISKLQKLDDKQEIFAINEQGYALSPSICEHLVVKTDTYLDAKCRDSGIKLKILTIGC
jgi:hypothetical protein